MQIAVTHKCSDFDALASLVAVTVLYPDALPVLPSDVNQNVKSFLAIHKDLFKLYSPKDINVDQVTSMVVVDANSWERLEGVEPLRKKKDLEVILWDHHVEGNIKADFTVQKETGATITLLIKEIEKQRKLITTIQATLFLMGIYEDTGHLTFSSTRSDDAHAAAYLLERKADLNILMTFLRQAYERKHKDILFHMLKKADRKKVNDFSISIGKIDIEGRIQNLAMVVQMYREIINVDAAFGIFRQTETDKCMVIARSGTDKLNMGYIMRSMGGGGHPGAGSALLKNVNPDVIEEMILELVKGNQQSSIMISDIMSYPVVTVHERKRVEQVARILKDVGCTGLPVVDGDNRITGVVSWRDFKKIKKSAHMHSPVKSIMSRNPVTLSPENSTIDVAKLMIKHDIGRIPIVDNKKIVGIVTRSDTMLYFYDLLPD